METRQTRLERRGAHEICLLEDKDTGNSAQILTSCGFNCYSLRCSTGQSQLEMLRTQDHFDEQPSRPSGNGIPILFPFPNRIRAGRFRFGGRQYDLPRNERDTNAIHGFVYDRRWRVIHAAAGSVTGQFHLSRDAAEIRGLWPSDFIIDVTYTLEMNQLACGIRVTNPDSVPLPWGFGTHPYFRFPLTPGDNGNSCSVVAPVTERWELSDLLPTGERVAVASSAGLDGRRPLSALRFDDVYTGLQFEGEWCNCELRDQRAGMRMRLRFDRLFRELVVFTPPGGGAICLEPYTCVTDAINLEAQGVNAGLRVLEPGKTADGRIVIEVTDH